MNAQLGFFVARKLLRKSIYRTTLVLQPRSFGDSPQFPIIPKMSTELEKARVTELQVRMDCNGCVRRIKKAMHNIDGVYDVYTDIAQQKLTVVGRADPEKLVKAIKKARKTATICSHTEPGEPGRSEPQPTEPTASSGPPTSDTANQPPSEATEPPKDAPPQEHPSPEVKPSPEPKDASRAEARDVGEAHMVHHYPHGYGYREDWSNYPPSGHEIRHEAPYYMTTHSYSTNRPSPYVSEYGYVRSQPRDMRYNAAEDYGDGYDHNRVGDGNQITSMFSDENPNACRIV